MVDMTYKLSFINRDEDGYIKSVGNLVGVSYKEAEERAKSLEKSQGDHYELIKDEKIFQIIMHYHLSLAIYLLRSLSGISRVSMASSADIFKFFIILRIDERSVLSLPSLIPSSLPSS